MMILFIHGPNTVRHAHTGAPRPLAHPLTPGAPPRLQWRRPHGPRESPRCRWSPSPPKTSPALEPRPRSTLRCCKRQRRGGMPERGGGWGPQTLPKLRVCIYSYPGSPIYFSLGTSRGFIYCVDTLSRAEFRLREPYSHQLWMHFVDRRGPGYRILRHTPTLDQLFLRTQENLTMEHQQPWTASHSAKKNAQTAPLRQEQQLRLSPSLAWKTACPGLCACACARSKRRAIHTCRSRSKAGQVRQILELNLHGGKKHWSLPPQAVGRTGDGWWLSRLSLSARHDFL